MFVHVFGGLSKWNHLRCTCVKEEGVCMGCTGWDDWKGSGFLRRSGEESGLTDGRSWFRLMICKASCVFPAEATIIVLNDYSKYKSV